jgi:hypothetical protein
MEMASAHKRRQLHGLALEGAQHQSLSEIAPVEFNSRRLHQPSRASQARGGRLHSGSFLQLLNRPCRRPTHGQV